MTIPPLVTAGLALGAGFLIVHLLTRTSTPTEPDAPEQTKIMPDKPGTPGGSEGIVAILGEGGSFITEKLGL